MKSIKQLVIVALAFIMLVSSAFAYEKSLPIGSRAKLASEAIRQVKRIYGGMYANGGLQPIDGTSYYDIAYNAKIPTAAGISALVASQKLSFRVANPTNDWISYYMYCLSPEGYTLFSGGNGFRLTWTEKAGGVWQVPEDALQFEPYLAYEVPIKRKGVVGARIISRDQHGNVIAYVYLST